MHYEIVRRSPHSPWLLLVHGMMANAANWLPNRDALSTVCNLLVVDLPGHGESPPLRCGALPTLRSMTGRLEEIRREVGIARWYLCGQSFGAGLTLHYALDHPDRVVAQAFTNAQTVFRDIESTAEREQRAARVAALREAGMEALRRERFHPRFARRFPAPIRDRLVKDAERIHVPTYLHFVAEIAPAMSLKNRTDGAPRVPTLLINGRHERIFQPFRDALAAAWPSLEIADLDGGHAVNVENPDGFSSALLQFIARHPNRSQS